MVGIWARGLTTSCPSTKALHFPKFNRLRWWLEILEGVSRMEYIFDQFCYSFLRPVPLPADPFNPRKSWSVTWHWNQYRIPTGHRPTPFVVAPKTPLYHYVELVMILFRHHQIQTLLSAYHLQINSGVHRRRCRGWGLSADDDGNLHSYVDTHKDFSLICP